jgi:hypothetical protein
MSADPVFDHHLRNAILARRLRIRFEDGRPYDARCSTVAAALEEQFGWKRRFGRLRLLDARVCWQHCWNQLPGGRILDATADQFESRRLGDMVVLEASDPMPEPISPSRRGGRSPCKNRRRGSNSSPSEMAEMHTRGRYPVRTG